MGMHFGIVASRSSLEGLFRVLGELGCRLRPVRPLNALEDAPQDRSATYLIAGESDGASYLIDPAMLLSAGEPDLLAALAHRTGTVVVGCGAETGSGTFWFTAFDGQELRRMFWMCRSDLSTPFGLGKAFGSEASHPLDAGLDAPGIFAALGELGFDFKAWHATGPYQLLTLENMPKRSDRPLEVGLKEHCSRHRFGRPGETSIRGEAQDSLAEKNARWKRLIESIRRK